MVLIQGETCVMYSISVCLFPELIWSVTAETAAFADQDHLTNKNE